MKKFNSFMLAALLAAPVMMSAEAWDGATKSEPAVVDGYYQVSNGAELAWISDYVNAGNKGINFVLTNDIDLGNHRFYPIAKVKSNGFTGNFDGQNHEIFGLYIEGYTSTTADDACLGLFGFTNSATQTIQNVTIHGKIYVPAGQTTGTQAGMLVGKSDKTGTVYNCHSDGTIEIDGAIGYVGGIFGFKKAGTLKNCSFTGKIIINGTVNKGVGGILGTTNSTGDNQIATLDGCWYNGQMLGEGTITSYSGGIEGYCALKHKNTEGSSMEYIKNCYVLGSIKHTAEEKNQGLLYGSVVNSGNYLKRTNNYYSSSVVATGLNDKGFAKNNPLTIKQFHSGEACYIINAGAGEFVYGQDLSEANSLPGVYTAATHVYKLTIMTEPAVATFSDYPEGYFDNFVATGAAYTNPSLVLPAAPEGKTWTDAEGNALENGATVTGDMNIYAVGQVPTGIESVSVENGNAVYYNLQGRRVNNPQNGIFIRRDAKGATKVVF